MPAEGSTLVQFRSYDLVGNASPWATATVMIDRANPTDPVVSGGSPAWQSVTSLHLAAAGSVDTGSGIHAYQLETSTDGGLIWSAPADASSLTVTAQGETLVRFRAVDVSGRFSNWVTGIARIDHTAPVAPTLTGGSLGVAERGFGGRGCDRDDGYRWLRIRPPQLPHVHGRGHDLGSRDDGDARDGVQPGRDAGAVPGA